MLVKWEKSDVLESMSLFRNELCSDDQRWFVLITSQVIVTPRGKKHKLHFASDKQ